MELKEGQVFGQRLILRERCTKEDFETIGIRVPERIDKFCLTKCLNCGRILPGRRSDMVNNTPKRCMYCSNIGNHFNVETTRNSWLVDGDVAYCNIEYNGGTIQFSIDAADYNRTKDLTWRVSKKKNKYYIISGSKKKNNMEYLHSFILGEKEDGKEIDHIDGNSLNNRKSNLRLVSHIENIHNIRACRIDNQIGIRGISYDKRSHLYVVDLSHNNVRFYVKPWKTIEEAVWCRYAFEEYFNLPMLKCNPEFAKYQNINEETKMSIKEYVLNKILGNQR